MKKSFRLIAVALAVLSFILFIYGCMKLTQAEATPPPANLSFDVPGVKVEVVDTNLRNRAVTILSVSGLVFLASLGVGIYSFRPAQST